MNSLDHRTIPATHHSSARRFSRTVAQHARRRALLPLFLAMSTFLAACGGQTSASSTPRTRTVLVTASDGQTTRTLPVEVTFPN
jgi:hypothetical protein